MKTIGTQGETMRQNFADIDDTHSLVSIPPGQYPCILVDARLHVSRDGSPRWGVHWKVLSGILAGKTAAWDNLNWSERGLPRVKQVLKLLGFDVSGVLELEPSDLLGCKALVQVAKEAYEDELTGQRIERLSVPYNGYEALEEDPGGAPEWHGEGARDQGDGDGMDPESAAAEDPDGEEGMPF
ncbi:MAG: hypothetical protein P1V35_12385 [Planctomycetota bacterium]|nr:hypothetical protein [Planctomycetota bacterium]